MIHELTGDMYTCEAIIVLHASTLKWSTNSNMIHEHSHDPRTHRRHVHLRGNHRVTRINSKMIHELSHDPRTLIWSTNSPATCTLARQSSCYTHQLWNDPRTLTWSTNSNMIHELTGDMYTCEAIIVLHASSVCCNLALLQNFSKVSSIVLFYFSAGISFLHEIQWRADFWRNLISAAVWHWLNFSKVSSVVFFYSKFSRKQTLENVEFLRSQLCGRFL